MVQTVVFILATVVVFGKTPSLSRLPRQNQRKTRRDREALQKEDSWVFEE